MSITIEIDATLEAALKQRAHEAGLTIEQLAQLLLEQNAVAQSGHHPRVAASLKSIERLKGKLGPVPTGAASSELLYGDI